MKQLMKEKTLHFRFKDGMSRLRVHMSVCDYEAQGGPIPEMPIVPGPCDTVPNPFTVSGTYDRPGVEPVIHATLEGDPTVTELDVSPHNPPPDGAEWAYDVTVPQPGYYTVTDTEGSARYDIVHVRVI